MADKIHFELVAPERLLLSDAVDMVVVPGSEGNFGVLPGHTPMISTVRPEVIDVYEDGDVRDRIFVAGGFAEVTPERCTVLAEEAIPVGDLDRAMIEQRIRELEEEVRDTDDEAERRTYEALLDAEEVKLAVIDRLARGAPAR